MTGLVSGRVDWWVGLEVCGLAGLLVVGDWWGVLSQFGSVF